MTVNWLELEAPISTIEHLLEEYDVEITSPDGWVPVVDYIDKGEYEEYVLTTETGLKVRCNARHLFKINDDWWYAEDACDRDNIWVSTDRGYEKCSITKTEKKIPIVDITVDHPNHRYYSNNVESHNTHVGKSLTMCHMAAANLAAGYNVLYISMEMSEARIAERIDANLLNTNINELKDLPKETYLKRVESLRKKTTGKLIVKEYPTSGASATNFKHLLNELKIKKNFVPDIIYIDYLNICASSRVKQGPGVNSYTYVKNIAEELRALAIEFNLPLVTATQTTREGIYSSDLDMTNTSESISLAQLADFFLALISTDELKALNQYLCKQLKNRYRDVGMNTRFVIGVDRLKMRLYNVEESAQDDLMQDVVFDQTPSGQATPKPSADLFKDFK